MSMKVFTEYVRLWTRVHSWTRVQILPCPAKIFTGHKNISMTLLSFMNEYQPLKIESYYAIRDREKEVPVVMVWGLAVFI